MAPNKIDCTSAMRAPYLDKGRSVDTGIDCEGVVLWGLAEMGFDIDPAGDLMQGSWANVSEHKPRVGDVIFSLNEDGGSHVELVVSITRGVRTLSAHKGLGVRERRDDPSREGRVVYRLRQDVQGVSKVVQGSPRSVQGEEPAHSAVWVAIAPDPFDLSSARRERVAWRPGLTVADVLSEVSADGLEDWRIALNGVHIPGDVTDTLVPSGGNLVLVGSPGGGEGLLAIVVNLLVAAAVSYGFSLLFPPPGLPSERDDESSPTYAFSGIGNNRAEGLPIPIAYGHELRTGGSVIAEYVRVQSIPPITDLFMLLCLSEGPIASIGDEVVDTSVGSPLRGDNIPRGMRIAANEAKNFDGVEVDVRLGSNEQASIPGFFEVRQATAAAQALLGLETTDLDNSANYVDDGQSPFTTALDDEWNAYGVGFTFSDEGDQFVVRVNFPQGLWSGATSGATLTSTFMIQFRYRILDGGGLPITTGGSNGDGWVRVAPSPVLVAAQRGSFDYEYRHPFVDPTNWVAPTFGRMLEGNGSSWKGSASKATANPYVSGDVINELSVSVWVEIDAFPSSPSVDDQVHIVGDYTAANKKGWSLIFVYREWTVVGSEQYGWTPAVQTGYGSTQAIHSATAAGGLSEEIWQPGSMGMLTFTWESESLNGTGRFRLYSGTHIIVSRTHNADLVADDQTISVLRHAGSPSASTWLDGKIDDLTIFDGYLSPEYVAFKYSSRLFGPSHDDLVGHWGWNTASTTIPQEVSSAARWWGNMSITSSSQITAIGSGIVLETAGTGDRVRAKFQLEALRLNRDSTHSRTFDDCEVSSWGTVLETELAYPNLAIVGSKIRATEQLNSTTPTTTYLHSGMLVGEWDRASTTNPSFNQVRSGNPGWIARNILINQRVGFGWSFKPADPDIVSLSAWADYCDEVLYDWQGTTGPVEADTSWGGNLYFDAGYVDAVTGDVRGAITINFSSNIPPSQFAVGKLLQFFDVPAKATFDTLLNNDGATDSADEFSGYEIARSQYWGDGSVTGLIGWKIDVYWDRLDEDDPWTDGTTYGAAAGYVRGAVRRFQFNGVFDKVTNGWDALLKVCSVGRCMPIRIGRRIFFRYSHPRDPVALVSSAMILPGSFRITYEGGGKRANAMDATFSDAALLHERSVEPVVHDSVADISSTSAVRRESKDFFGVTERVQVHRQARFILNTQQEVSVAGSFKVGTESLGFETGDVIVLSHDILPRGYGGRVKEDATFDTQVRSDVPFTIDPGATDYTFYIRRKGSNDFTTAPVSEGATGHGDSPAGTLIKLSSGLGFEPERGTSFNIVRDTDLLKVEIASITTNADLTRSVKWVEYVATIYEDDPPDELTTAAAIDDSGGLPDRDALPEHVTSVSVDDTVTRQGQGGFSARLNVSWTFAAGAAATIKETRVWIRQSAGVELPLYGTHDASTVSNVWTLVTTVRGPQASAEAPVDRLEPGDLIEVAVQPVTTSGLARTVDTSGRQLHQVVGIGAYPGAPTSVAMVFNDDQKAVYSWALTEDEPGLVVECRRGGWLCGDVVFVSQPGALEFGPTRNWAGATNGDPTLYFRARNAIGQYSPAALLTSSGYTLAPVTDTDFGVPGDWDDDAWEDFGSADGWENVLPNVGEPSQNNLEVTASGILQWDSAGSSLTGNYTCGNSITYALGSGDETPGVGEKPRRVFVETALVAAHIHPVTWGTAMTWGGEKVERWTWEGPTHLLPGETANATVIIEARIITDGGTTFGAWRVFKPGEYSLSAIQFRLVFTRPTTGYDIQVSSFRTRVRGVGRTIHDRSQATALLEREVFE